MLFWSKNVVMPKSIYYNVLIINTMGGGVKIRFIINHFVILYLQPYLPNS
jgi:hypothetical protein